MEGLWSTALGRWSSKVARRRGHRCPAVERTEEDEDAFSSASTDRNGKLVRAPCGQAWWAGSMGCGPMVVFFIIFMFKILFYFLILLF
jgi:hypothetical protein